jgi:8-hydroxy-5-deazaflavin:NADPH oxidoreductase
VASTSYASPFSQPLDVFLAGDEDGAKETVAQLMRDGGLRAIDVGPLERTRPLEGLGFLGLALQQPLGLNFQNAWKLIS